MNTISITSHPVIKSYFTKVRLFWKLLPFSN